MALPKAKGSKTKSDCVDFVFIAQICFHKEKLFLLILLTS